MSQSSAESESAYSSMNASEAERCIEIAIEAEQAGDWAKAERFLSKSIKLHNTSEAQNLLNQLKLRQSQQQSNTTAKGGSTTPSPTFASSTNSPGSGDDQSLFTPEQREAALAISKLTNYYEILSLSRTATDSDIKTAYRRLAVKFHPDKNRAPEAEEAFKLVSAAYQCLSDIKKREHYDRFGEDETRRSSSSSMPNPQHYSRDQDISPEEIFNMFFNMQTGRSYGNRRVFNTFRHRPDRTNQHSDDGGESRQFSMSANLMQFAHFLPLLLLFLVSIIGSPSSSEDTPYSLQRTEIYSQQRITDTSNLPYYVQNSFSYRYARDKRALFMVESMVERDYVKHYSETCERERAARKRKLREAPGEAGRAHIEDMEKANDPIEACTKLSKIQVG